ncbi:hypothetical protein B0T19DRAFT_139841 [Cercophora scortea]|uniref:RNase MRP protein 1 RNA binding domain-containing protein n=1 Tax=Cercophora scortea TaxID=314031 RepID=A0AAE0IYY2_9PEZI|nr:hypothetical protein B0T19DRAFT_139841 [Cercophora scortea]
MAPRTETPLFLPKGASAGTTAAVSKPSPQGTKTPKAAMAMVITAPLLEQALGTLLPALELLERFHHRNKNQHRLSKWWAHADMLRRHLRKLAHILDAMETSSSTAGKSKTKKKWTKAEHEALAARAAFLRRRVVPNAYDGFARLVADRQFAHLGLMLMGVLAQVDGALAPFAEVETVGEDGAEEEGHQVSSLGAPGLADGGEKDRSSNLKGGVALPHHDFGVAVSRKVVSKAAGSGSRAGSDDIQRRKPSSSSSSKPLRKSAQHPSPPSPDPATTTTATTAAAPEKAPLPSIKPAEDNDDNQTSSTRKPKKESRPRKRPAEVQNPEDEEEGGEARDEFDDIFSSLPKKTKTKKKKTTAVTDTDSVAKSAKKKKTSKKKGGGDEFDDIFNSLF